MSGSLSRRLCNPKEDVSDEVVMFSFSEESNMDYDMMIEGLNCDSKETDVDRQLNSKSWITDEDISEEEIDSPLLLKGRRRSYSRCSSCRDSLLPSFDVSPRHLPSVGSTSRVALHSSSFQDSLRSDSTTTLKVLGKGSFGTVILGRLNDERVAVKVIPRESAKDRLSLEGEANAELLDHENIVRVFGFFHDVLSCDDNLVIVMEYVGRTNLQRLILEENHIVTESFIHRTLLDLSDALCHSHSKGVWHLDVKPSNVFVTSSGVCKLGDFGCSHLAGLSGEGILRGTPGYQAPEMLRNRSANEKSDVYSFGIFMWQLIHRAEHPYAGLHPHEILFRVVSEDIRPPDQSTLSVALSGYRRLYRNAWDKSSRRRPDMETLYRDILPLAKVETNSRRVPR